MKNIFSLIIGLSFGVALFAQDYSDSERLAKMEYLKYADRINCDSSNHSNLEHRICLNLEFQKLDSTMNVRFNSLLKKVKEDSIKRQFIDFQKSWEDHRRLQSEWIARGSRGHLLGIYYLSGMVNSTKKRIEEIEYLMEMK